MKDFVIRRYDRSGEVMEEMYYDDIVKLLHEFVRYRSTDSTEPSIWKRLEGNKFVRIHNYGYKEVTIENVHRYLNERILETDRLLENVKLPVKYRKKVQIAYETLKKLEVWLDDQLASLTPSGSEAIEAPEGLKEILQALKKGQHIEVIF